MTRTDINGHYTRIKLCRGGRGREGDYGEDENAVDDWALNSFLTARRLGRSVRKSERDFRHSGGDVGG